MESNFVFKMCVYMYKFYLQSSSCIKKAIFLRYISEFQFWKKSARKIYAVNLKQTEQPWGKAQEQMGK